MKLHIYDYLLNTKNLYFYPLKAHVQRIIIHIDMSVNHAFWEKISLINSACVHILLFSMPAANNSLWLIWQKLGG